MNKITLLIIGLILIIIGISSLIENTTSNTDTKTTPSSTIQNQDIPKPTGFVNDNAFILSELTRQSLEQQLKIFSEKGKGEIAILTVQSLNGLSIDEFGIRVGEKWKVGKKESDNGIIIIIALSERKVKIEVGRGSSITDAQAGDILDTYMVPLLKTEDWNGAIIAGVDALIEKINEK